MTLVDGLPGGSASADCVRRLMMCASLCGLSGGGLRSVPGGDKSGVGCDDGVQLGCDEMG